ncbi:MAG: homoserine O-succinyltransferase, partial [Acetobacterium sp.]|nr:homoserine O-succinyltransferase [Acetobacterium sp.]
VEQNEFEDVDYWQDLCRIMEWTKSHVFSSLYICWGAQAALYYYYGVQKAALQAKVSGVYSHLGNNRRHPIVRGFDDVFFAPHSRYTAISRDDVLAVPELELLAESPEAGVYLVSGTNNRQLFVTGHCEFDRVTLKNEYIRDYLQGLKPELPKNYKLKGEIRLSDQTSWSSHATLLFTNWLNYYVYQQTPYYLKELSS